MKVRFNEAERCPLCGNTNITYHNSEFDECGATYEAHCDACDASWNETYDLKFSGVWCITDKDGNEYEDAPIDEWEEEDNA